MTKPSTGVGLFESDLEAGSPIVFLTNRFNLLEILSSGLVTPRSAFGKYYADLLDAAQGRVPLLQAPLTPDISSRVASGDGMAFPVAIEVDPTCLAPVPITALGNEGATEAIPLQGGRAKIWAASGVIPSVSLRKVHFRSAAELDEHKLREYDNLRTDTLELAVSPSLFEGGTLSAAEADRWLASLQPVATPSAEEFAQHDRLAGARCLAAHAADARWLEGLAVFLGATGASTSSKALGFPSWLTVENTIRPRETGWRGRSAEERLFCSTVRVLRRVNPAEAWRPLQVLDDVQAAVAATQLPKKDELQLSKQFVAMRAILRNEKEFKPFRPGVGSPVIKAILMVLMRPEPSRLLSWAKADTGADDEVQLTAEVLVGVLQGHKRLSIEYRQPALDRLIALTSALEISAGLRDAFRPLAGGVRLEVSTHASDGEADTTSLTWDGLTVVSKDSRRGVLTEVIRTLDVKDPAITRVLTSLCVDKGWTDCVRSVVTTTDRNWSAAPRAVGSGLEIVVLGPVSVRVEIEIEVLQERLSKAALSIAEEERFARQLRGGGTRHIDSRSGGDTPPRENPKVGLQPRVRGVD